MVPRDEDGDEPAAAASRGGKRSNKRHGGEGGEVLEIVTMDKYLRFWDFWVAQYPKSSAVDDMAMQAEFLNKAGLVLSKHLNMMDRVSGCTAAVGGPSEAGGMMPSNNSASTQRRYWNCWCQLAPTWMPRTRTTTLLSVAALVTTGSYLLTLTHPRLPTWYS